ncbi:butyrophilin subfamily 2 member A2-like [Centropristis striata]|uniref:butyrophilin subfamily 2 member A2-like n=1 Tax=Centropristis striata TaxID=184440 RepID=UPI0027E1A9FB|nr:butyrophilin subfamily 2 member A2-like [Centropristis striata]
MDLEGFTSSVSLSPLFFVVLLLIFCCTPVEGQSAVVGPLQPIVAVPGDDVILPCHVEPPVNVARLTVEWSRPDIQPDPNDRLRGVDYVHLYRDSREVPDMKLSSYVSRTTLFRDGLRRGNISLKIINVTLQDQGAFRCFIPKLKSKTQFSIVNLVVVPKSNTWTTETPQQTPDQKEERGAEGVLSERSRLIPVVVFSVFLMILAVGVTAYFTQCVTKCQKQKLIKPSLLSSPC